MHSEIASRLPPPPPPAAATQQQQIGVSTVGAPSSIISSVPAAATLAPMIAPPLPPAPLPAPSLSNYMIHSSAQMDPMYGQMPSHQNLQTVFQPPPPPVSQFHMNAVSQESYQAQVSTDNASLTGV